MVKAVLASNVEPSGLRLVALVLAWHANEKTGHAWPSLSTIASEAGLSRDRAKKCVRELRQAGVIEQVTAGGGSVSTKYRFTDSWVGAQAPRGAHTPGVSMPLDRGCPRPKPGVPAHPNKEERKAKPSLSSKTRRSAAAGPGRSAPGSSLAAARTGFTDPSYYDQEVLP